MRGVRHALGVHGAVGTLAAGLRNTPVASWTRVLHFAVDPQIGTNAAVDRVVDLGGRVDIDPCAEGCRVGRTCTR